MNKWIDNIGKSLAITKENTGVETKERGPVLEKLQLITARMAAKMDSRTRSKATEWGATCRKKKVYTDYQTLGPG